MTALILVIAFVVCISFACSFTEAALYAVGPAYVRLLREKGTRTGRILVRFKENMDKPISAILIMNTIANVGGAGIAGAIAVEIWGERGVALVSILFTGLILLCGEVIPKVIGVAFHRKAAVLYAFPLSVATRVLAPIIWFTGRIAVLFRGNPTMLQAPEEEIMALTHISAEEGSILPIEKQIITHTLALNNVAAGSIMTPRTVLLAVDGNRNIGEFAKEAVQWKHSRIPVYEEQIENIVGMIFRREVLGAILGEQDLDRPIKALAKPMHLVPEMITGDKLLNEFLRLKSHLFGVVDEYGEIIGVVSLEDVIETLLGTEILDETDSVADMQELARRKWKERSALRHKGDKISRAPL